MSEANFFRKYSDIIAEAEGTKVKEKEKGCDEKDDEDCDEELNEYFEYDDASNASLKKSMDSDKKTKSQDVLGRRRPGEIGAYPKDYKAMKKGEPGYAEYPIGGPKGKLPENKKFWKEFK